MKRVLLTLGIYAVFVFGFCIGGTFIYGNAPRLLPGMEGHYIFLRGLSWFFKLLPAITLSGFTVGCSIHWQKNIRDSRKRFSQAMLRRYRNILFISIGLVFILMLNNEIFLPSTSAKIKRLESEPGELNHAIDTATMLLQQDRPVLAWQYAMKATSIAPADPIAAHVLKRSIDAVELQRDRERHLENASYRTAIQAEKPMHTLDESYSVSELVRLAKAEVESENWFMAHYWANLAVEACEGTDTNFPQATEIASLAWNKLNRPSPYKNKEVNDYFNKKREAYNAFYSGDSLKAYYIFHSLAGEHTVDPDVIRFEELAREDVEGQYFFYDEVESIPQLANSHDIYFTISTPNSGRMVFFIKHAMSMKKDGGLVRYLDDVTIVQFTRSGDFIRSVYAPAAKVIFQSVSAFDRTTRIEKGLQDEWKNVPLLILQSVDRKTEGLMSKPEYNYEEAGIPEEYMKKCGMRRFESSATTSAAPRVAWKGMVPEQNILVLPMPYEDFALITDASLGPTSMSLSALNDFINKSTRYGFASELFTENFVCRILYPLYMLALFIIAATMGWNYRIEDSKILFRFIWLLLIPIFSALVFLILEFLMYFFNIVNFVIVSGFHTSALMIAFVVYLLLFTVASIVFASRKM